MSRILEKRHVIISEVRYDLLKPLWSSYWRWQEVHQHCRLLMETFLFPAYWALKFEISVTVSFFPITGPKSRDATLELSSNFFFKKKATVGHQVRKSQMFFWFWLHPSKTTWTANFSSPSRPYSSHFVVSWEVTGRLWNLRHIPYTSTYENRSFPSFLLSD